MRLARARATTEGQPIRIAVDPDGHRIQVESVELRLGSRVWVTASTGGTRSPSTCGSKRYLVQVDPMTGRIIFSIGEWVRWHDRGGQGIAGYQLGHADASCGRRRRGYKNGHRLDCRDLILPVPGPDTGSQANSLHAMPACGSHQHRDWLKELDIPLEA